MLIFYQVNGNMFSHALQGIKYCVSGMIGRERSKWLTFVFFIFRIFSLFSLIFYFLHIQVRSLPDPL